MLYKVVMVSIKKKKKEKIDYDIRKMYFFESSLALSSEKAVLMTWTWID